MSKNVRQVKTNSQTSIQALAITSIFILAFLVSFSMKIASLFSDYGQTSWNPIVMIILMIKGKASWGILPTIIITLLTIIIISTAYFVYKNLPGNHKGKTRIDAAQKYLGGEDDYKTLSKEAVTAQAQSWFTSGPAVDQPGFMFGHAPGRPKKQFWGSWEDLYLIIFGPRMGKTTSQVIPAIVDAPGAVVTTSNKRDIVDDTIKLTSARGETWVFDPQNIAQGFEQKPWFFDPLDMIRRDPEKMDANAESLADIFRCAALGEPKGGDDYWVSSGRGILASMFLAAALDDQYQDNSSSAEVIDEKPKDDNSNEEDDPKPVTIHSRPITDVFTWITDPSDRTPIEILSRFPQWEKKKLDLLAMYNLPSQTRGGVFGQAKTMAAPLGFQSAKWIIPNAKAIKFSPYDFVRNGRPTMYILSKTGAGNAAALTTALVAAIMQEAERYGESCGGRLKVPLVAALDEAANVVKWPELPDLYSHYGSRSIILMTILQSYSQGVRVWGEEGMEALWSATPVLIYGGGVKDDTMLRKMEALIGDALMSTSSTSRSKDGRSTSTSYQERKILTQAELSALQQWRAIVFSSKRRPIIAELVPFWKREWPEEIKELLQK